MFILRYIWLYFYANFALYNCKKIASDKNEQEFKFNLLKMYNIFS